jgi:hypothetical protein
MVKNLTQEVLGDRWVGGFTNMEMYIFLKNITQRLLKLNAMKKLYSLFFFLLIAAFANAQTNVSGGIYVNTTWTLAGSPYIVVDTVVVFPGVTLTIDPGVEVRFDNNKRLEIRQGTLIAQGTIIDSITFTSNSPTPSPGIWDRVWVNGGTSTSLNYCNFKYAKYGLYGNQNTVRNSNFTFNLSGCFAWYVDSCNFYNNTTLGLAGGVISNCNILNNGTGVGGLNTQITNCVVNYNQNGIDVGWGDIDNCIVKYNQKGIANSQQEENSIKNSIIDSNSIVGVELDSWDSLINCEIKYNGIGVDATSSNDCVISGNIIENNSTGIRTGYSGAIYSNRIDNNLIGIEIGNMNNIYCNRICNNTSYDLKLMSAASFSVPNNYWCTPDSLSTTTVIYDGYDDISLGIISFMPLDTVNCYLTGCNLGISANVTNATCDTCPNGSATAIVTNGFAPYSYAWYTSPIQTSQTATALASGTYTVCVTDANGCTACNYNVFVDSTNCTGFAVSTTVTNASCSACSDGTATANISAGTPPYVYTWYSSPIQNTQTATGLPTGSYAVCVTDLYGCAVCDTATIGIGSCSAYYTIIADPNPHTYDLTNMASGTPPLTYDWSWGDGSPNDTGAYPSHTYAQAGTYTICLNITDSAGCTDSYCQGYYLLGPMSSTAVIVNVIPPVTTGIEAVENAKSFFIYPNPAKNSFRIQTTLKNAEVEIYNLVGEKIYSGKLTEQAINMNSSAGMFFVKVSDGENVFIKKLVIE